MRVAVIGAGYVGLVTSACLADAGHTVVCVDLDAAKVEAINARRPPIHEQGLARLLARTVTERLTATADLRGAVAASAVTFITVGTPFDGQRIDLAAVEQATAAVGEALHDAVGYPVVVVKSTVVPGTTDDVVVPLLERHSGKTAGKSIGVAMNPEFLREGQAIADFMHPDRIVLGIDDARTLAVLEELYAVLPGAPVLHTTRRTAEMIKYVSNALLATLVSFANEIADLCAEVDGVDAVDVMRGVKLDRRLNPVLPDGARVTPGVLDYLDPGCGFGGSCLPKDIHALTAFAADRGVPLRLLEQVVAVNDARPLAMIRLLRRHFTDLSGRRVAVLGLAFKPGTDDLRCSPALPIVHHLREAGARVAVYDPVVDARSLDGLWSASVDRCASLTDAVRSADAVLLVTRWPEFADLPRVLDDLGVTPLVVDGRRMLEAGSVPRYEGIGR